MVKYSIFLLMLVVASMTTVVRAAPLDPNAYIWLSGSSTIPSGTSLGEVPTLTVAPGSINNQIQVWARPQAGKTLENWSLNLGSTNSTVLDFSALVFYNPTVISGTPGTRWEFTNNGSISAPNPDQITSFQGFTVLGTAAGIGPSTTAVDPFYDSVEDAWLLATVFYNAVGVGTTNLFLQIGNNGINHAGGSSAQTNVVFGALTDPALNGNTQRGIDSLTADATINVVPLPAAVWLFGTGLLGIVGMARRKKAVSQISIS